MSTATLNVSEYDVIANVVQHYIDGAKSGKGDDMKPAFHEDATIFGYAGDVTLFVPGEIQRAFSPGLTRPDPCRRRGSKHGSPGSRPPAARSPPCELANWDRLERRKPVHGMLSSRCRSTIGEWKES